jgi:uncharacterized Ntn-hydrolase superfamily protein
MTYSIVARDPESGALGVAVQSHFFAVGSVVTWAQAGVGAVATQSFAEVSYGPRGLLLMRGGATAAEALELLIKEDVAADARQVAFIDCGGRTAIHTGASCVQAAGHAVSLGVAAQANMVSSDACWTEMVRAYESVSGSLPERLLHSLMAAESTGGDLRGRQSAALLVVDGTRRENWWEGRMVDVRVDDHPDPLPELARLVGLSGVYQVLARALFVGGPLSERLDRKAALGILRELELAQRLADDNPEPSIWRAVLSARLGLYEDAKECISVARTLNPGISVFLHRLSDAGFLPGDLLS